MSLSNPRTEGEFVLASIRRNLDDNFDVVDKSELSPTIPDPGNPGGAPVRNPYREEGFILIATGALDKFPDRASATKAADEAAGKLGARKGATVARAPGDEINWIWVYGWGA